MKQKCLRRYFSLHPWKETNGRHVVVHTLHIGWGNFFLPSCGDFQCQMFTKILCTWEDFQGLEIMLAEM